MILTLSSLRLGKSENTTCTLYDTVCFDTSNGPAIYELLKVLFVVQCSFPLCVFNPPQPQCTHSLIPVPTFSPCICL